jgi:hypothetical protein
MIKLLSYFSLLRENVRMRKEAVEMNSNPFVFDGITFKLEEEA